MDKKTYIDICKYFYSLFKNAKEESYKDLLDSFRKSFGPWRALYSIDRDSLIQVLEDKIVEDNWQEDHYNILFSMLSPQGFTSKQRNNIKLRKIHKHFDSTKVLWLMDNRYTYTDLCQMDINSECYSFGNGFLYQSVYLSFKGELKSYGFLGDFLSNGVWDIQDVDSCMSRWFSAKVR